MMNPSPDRLLYRIKKRPVEDLPGLIGRELINDLDPERGTDNADLLPDIILNGFFVPFAQDENDQKIIHTGTHAPDVNPVHDPFIDLVEADPVAEHLDHPLQAPDDIQEALLIPFGDIAGPELPVPVVSTAEIFTAGSIPQGDVFSAINQFSLNMLPLDRVSFGIDQSDLPVRNGDPD